MSGTEKFAAVDVIIAKRDGHVLMTGPVEFEWEGTLDPALFSSAA